MSEQLEGAPGPAFGRPHKDVGPAPPLLGTGAGRPGQKFCAPSSPHNEINGGGSWLAKSLSWSSKDIGERPILSTRCLSL